MGYTDPFPGRDKCNVHFIQHLLLGRTLLGANIFDGMRAIDFLITRKEVDKNRKVHQIVKKAYRVAEAEDNLWIEVFPGEHSFSGRRAFDFFKKYLS